MDSKQGRERSPDEFLMQGEGLLFRGDLGSFGGFPKPCSIESSHPKGVVRRRVEVLDDSFAAIHSDDSNFLEFRIGGLGLYQKSLSIQ
jgi:hypothetical protein